MKTTSEKVIERLIKWGNNVNDSKEMVSTHLESSLNIYSEKEISAIAKYIRTVY